MSYLFFCALVSLIFGLLFLVSPDVLGTMGSVFNAGLFTLDSLIMRYRLWLGICLLAPALQANVSIKPAYVEVNMDEGRPAGVFYISNLGDITTLADPGVVDALVKGKQ